ncbi:MAG: Oligopeptide-binding protein AppA precursor [Pseudomonadota bacterium]|jgi:peptide/nickel transport system substrate-binding protein
MSLPLLILASLWACADVGGTVADAQGRRDTLVIGVPSDAKNMLYVVSSSASDSAIIEATTSSLFDSDFSCALRYTPEMATEWSFSEDGTRIDMTLRDDLTWEDGTRLTARDVAATYALVADPKVGSPRLDMTEHMRPDARPHVIDDTHLRWEFTHAYDRTTMLAHTSLTPVPAHRLRDADPGSLRSHPLNALAPLSSGPWRVATWEKNARLVLAPNDAWTGPVEDRPRLRRVIFKVLPEYATRLVELENGAIDLMEGVLVADADKLATEHPEISLHRRGWRSMDYVAWNSLDPADVRATAGTRAKGQVPDPTRVKPHPIFADREVRRALAGALDVERMIADLLTSRVTGEVYGRPAIGTITPALCGVHADDVAPVPYAPDAARARLAELGWRDTDGDGILDKAGQPMRFTLLLNSGNARREKAAVLVQAQLRRVGVDVQLDKVESNAFFERLRRRDYEAALSGWSAGLFVDPGSIWGEGSAFNFTSYRNPRVTALIAQGLAEPDPERARATWQELQRVIHEDQPYAFLYWMDEIVAVHDRFQDTTIDVLSPYRRLNRWSVPADRVKYRY